MKILVINCGSSSIKYQLLDMKNDEEYTLLAKGNLEKIALPDSKLTHKPSGKESVVINQSVSDHTIGMQLVLETLTHPQYGVISDFGEIDAVGHRVVQGADFFQESVLVDEDVMEKIKICCDFAPLHNPANILGIRAMQKVLPSVPQVVVFDTAFHQTMEPAAYMYALPYDCYEKYRIRRYGAHGTSHMYVSQRGIKFAGLDPENSRVITCHIGNGSSITAVKNGKCVDTSMGFTPLEGMIMGTRCGNIDASIIPYLMNKENLTPDQTTDLMNKKSGFAGLSGRSSDMRDVVGFATEGDERCQLVLDKLVHDITKNVGAYIAEMGGVDLIVFTAGIAENNPWLPVAVCRHFEYMGLKMNWDFENKEGVALYKEYQDSVKSRAVKDEAYLSAPDSKVKVALIPTDEELMIARDTMRLAQNLK